MISSLAAPSAPARGLRVTARGPRTRGLGGEQAEARGREGRRAGRGGQTRGAEGRLGARGRAAAGRRGAERADARAGAGGISLRMHGAETRRADAFGHKSVPPAGIQVTVVG